MTEHVELNPFDVNNIATAILAVRQCASNLAFENGDSHIIEAALNGNDSLVYNYIQDGADVAATHLAMTDGLLAHSSRKAKKGVKLLKAEAVEILYMFDHLCAMIDNIQRFLMVYPHHAPRYTNTPLAELMKLDRGNNVVSATG